MICAPATNSVDAEEAGFKISTVPGSVTVVDQRSVGGRLLSRCAQAHRQALR